MWKVIVLLSYRVLALLVVLGPIVINYLTNGSLDVTTNRNDLVTAFVYVPLISLLLSFIAIYIDGKVVDLLNKIKQLSPNIHTAFNNKVISPLKLSPYLNCKFC